jgi:integrase/recombinase XerD
MTELIIDILTALKQQGLFVDEQKTKFALEVVLDGYEITKKSYALSICTDLYDKINYFLTCKRMAGLASGTMANYTYILKDFYERCNKQTTQITIVDLRIYIAERSRERETVEPIINCLKSFFTWLQDEDLISKNPAKQLAAPKRSKHFRDALSIEQVENCRNSCTTQRERALFEFFLASGCRVSEVAGLKTENILSGRFLVVGKGDKERYCFINQRAKMYIRQYVFDRGFNSEYFSVSDKGKHQVLSERSIQDIFANIGKRCEVHLHPHIMRHTFATRALENGASLSVVQKLLGHESSATTEIYARNSAETIAAEYRKCVDF